VIGLLAISGHNWPVYLGFRGGGRGVFVSLGVITALSWQLGLIVLVVAYAWAPVKQVALGVFLALAALPFLSWFLFRPMGIVKEDRLTVTVGFTVLSLIALVKRLITHRSELSKGVPWGEILLNRLLFDRDIGDQRLWKAGSAKKGK
jgi:glycerol-3-phosphate acyltransferase PlsY